MTSREEALQRYEAAIKDPSAEHLAALREVMAKDVVVVGFLGAGQGVDAVLEGIGTQMPGLLSSATWSVSELDESSATVEASLPPGMPIRGLTLFVQFDGDGRLASVEQQMIAAPPPPDTELLLPPDIKEAIPGAITNGMPMVVAYVDAKGIPHLSMRGSTQPYSDTQLAIWIRDAEGGLLKAIATNPNVALFFRDPGTHATYQFIGQARVDSDPEVREVVYQNSPESERNFDARRTGVAVIIDLDRVEGMGPGGRVRMARGASAGAGDGDA